LSVYESTREELCQTPFSWLITGVAGFIGSHLLESLLMLDQRVMGLDNFSTGTRSNLEDVRSRAGTNRWARFTLLEGDIRSLEACRRACRGVDFVLHQAALGSVPRSIAEPLATHESNATGTLNMLVAARDEGVERFVYASSSSVYGDIPDQPKVESRSGRPLSPYAVTKAAGELYADVFARTHGMVTVGLRYFNVFGPRQDPSGPYAAVIPRWIGALLNDEPVVIYGDGETSRDFCYVANAVQASLLAAVVSHPGPPGGVYNVAVQHQTTLNELFDRIRERVTRFHPTAGGRRPAYEDFRPGDVRHSVADITRAREGLGYQPTHTLEKGLDEALEWYAGNAAALAR
jgi:UDP-N-acetylglucosamine 4-epimerase